MLHVNGCVVIISQLLTYNVSLPINIELTKCVEIFRPKGCYRTYNS